MTWHVMRDGKVLSTHETEPEAFAALLKRVPYSVHHATTHEGYALAEEWLCGCGYGSLRIAVQDIPWRCPMCEPTWTTVLTTPMDQGGADYEGAVLAEDEEDQSWWT